MILCHLKMKRWMGFEPMTFWFDNLTLYQLSYHRYAGKADQLVLPYIDLIGVFTDMCREHDNQCVIQSSYEQLTNLQGNVL